MKMFRALLVAVIAALPARAQTFDVTTATLNDITDAFADRSLTAEELVEFYLARIEAYDQKGPRLNAIITVNPKALEIARSLDQERKRRGPRSPLHGLPIVVKDNINTRDMPTTAGSFVLKGSQPIDDADVVARLRRAGVIILAKTNMSEFASGPVMSSVAGPMRNPHDVKRTPGGTSGGSAIAVAAAFAPLAIGTDTGGSVRVPAAMNGVVGLKTSFGLVSRYGVVPLAPAFDSVGPMGRHVADVAALLGAMYDQEYLDFTSALKRDALKGARIGVVRDYYGKMPGIDGVHETALAALRRAGAEVVEVSLPAWLRTTHIEWYGTVMNRQFCTAVTNYLATLEPSYPKTFDELVTRAMAAKAPFPNPSRWTPFAQPASRACAPDDVETAQIVTHGRPMAREIVTGVFDAMKLDAMVYPTVQRSPDLIDAPPNPNFVYAGPLYLANVSGLPELTLPIGVDANKMPVAMSLLGRIRDEGRLLSLAYALEQDLNAVRVPAATPPLD